MNLKAWKQTQKLTNQELAKLLKTTPGYVNHLLNRQDHLPSLKMCIRIIEVTKGAVTLEDLRPEMAIINNKHDYTKTL